MPLSPGTRLGPYEVTVQIGAGGMGEVYRAIDSRLGRAVALKVLPAEMAGDPDRLARFQREARAVAALNHPHIVTIHSVEEIDGIHLLTMELVEGQSLEKLIPDSGFSVDRIVAIGTALADALAAAHEKGIVHRDLKPANVMMTRDGRLKVLDFGLAKETRATDPVDATLAVAGRTEVGVVMGTPAYMSPEQVTGRDVDHRTDIFSLGILLYQAASGQRPFEGATSIELASAVLRDTPRPLGEIRSDVPTDLTRLIRRCLEKDPQRRVQTARDVANELSEIAQSASHDSRVKAAPSMVKSDSGATRAGEAFWIAVLPFKYAGSNADLSAFADELSGEVVTGLSRFSYLRVITRGSTGDVAARYVIEGSLRQAGATLRVAAQLVDTTTGAHLWAQTYDRPFRAEDLFVLQDDLVPRIVSTVADINGVLCRSMSDALRGRRPDQLTPYEAVLRGFGSNDRVTPEEHAQVREILEQAVRTAPDVSDCWALLSMIYCTEFHSDFNVRPDPLGRAIEAARRAVDTAPTSQLAHYALAEALFFRREMAAFRHAADRAVALNPMNSAATAFLGILLAEAGDWQKGCALVERAAQLNPQHPDWYWFGPFYNAYRQGAYQEALDVAARINMPHYFYTHVALAVAHAQLGEREAAAHAVRELLALKPDFGATARLECGKWNQPEMVEHLIDGLRKAGLAIPDDPASPAVTASVAVSPPSGIARADEGFWIAVLPFKYTGTNPDLAALAEGLCEEIVTGLSRFSYLRVITRGQTIGARYVVEGSVRQAGSQLRVAAQLVDTTTTAHLWAETYDRPFRAEDIFALQDDLVPRIVSTVADMNGVLCRSMCDALRGRRPDQLTPYEALLRSFGFNDRVTPEEHADVREILEHAVEMAPGESDCVAMLSLVYAAEFAHNLNPRPDSLRRAFEAARRAMEAGAASQLACYAMTEALFFRKEMVAFRHAAERTVALNPMDSATTAFIGILLAYSGDWERGCTLVERAAQLNPRHPGWYWFAPFYNAYRRGEYRAALDAAVKLNLPFYLHTSVALAAAHGQLGDREAAQQALRDLLALKPDFAATGLAEFRKWFQPDLVEHLVDGLRKAGLAVSAGE